MMIRLIINHDQYLLVGLKVRVRLRNIGRTPGRYALWTQFLVFLVYSQGKQMELVQKQCRDPIQILTLVKSKNVYFNLVVGQAQALVQVPRPEVREHR